MASTTPAISSAPPAPCSLRAPTPPGDAGLPSRWIARWAGRGGSGPTWTARPGLLLLGARYYAPALGRFLSRDPSGFVNGANLYAYCMDDPVNFHDPTGELSVGDVGGWIDEHMMGGATQHFGEVAGRYDAGKASPWEVAGAAANWGLELANTAFLAKDIGQLGLNAARNGLSRLPFRSSLGGGGPLEGGGGLGGGAPDDLITVSRWGRPGLEPGDWVMKGPANRWNYL